MMNQLTRGQQRRVMYVENKDGDIDSETGEEYWVSGVKKNGRDAHYAARINVAVDDDARAEYERIMGDR